MILSLTPSSVTSSLQAMAAASAAMAASQARISSGNRINSAKDDGAGYAIATHIKNSLVGENVRRQNQLRAISLLDVTQSAVGSISDILIQMKEKALAVTDTSLATVDKQALNNDITALTKQIDGVVTNSTFNGKNLLTIADTPPTTWPGTSGYQTSASSSGQTIGIGSGRMDVAIDLARAMSSNISINWGDGSTYTANDTYGSAYTGSTVVSHIYGEDTSSRTMSFNVSTTTAAAPVTMPPSAPPPAGVDVSSISFTPDPEKTRVAAYSDGSSLAIAHKSMSAAALGIDDLSSLTPAQAVAAVDNALRVSTDYGTYFAGVQSAAERALALTNTMSDAFEKSYGDLVDADISKESANWQAQQTKLALSTQSLQIASQAPNMLLSLFRQ